jgi:hypothetical protein
MQWICCTRDASTASASSPATATSRAWPPGSGRKASQCTAGHGDRAVRRCQTHWRRRAEQGNVRARQKGAGAKAEAGGGARTLKPEQLSDLLGKSAGVAQKQTAALPARAANVPRIASGFSRALSGRDGPSPFMPAGQTAEVDAFPRRSGRARKRQLSTHHERIAVHATRQATTTPLLEEPRQ